MRKSFLLMIGAILILEIGLISGCGDDVSSTLPVPPGGGGPISATDGDGIPELTANPSVSPATVAIDSNVTVNVTVDNDTTHATVAVGIFDGTTFFVYGQTLAAAVTPGGTTGVAVTVSSGFGAVPGTYIADITTCAGGLCTLGNPGRYYSAKSTYWVLDLMTFGLVGITTSVPPTFTVP